MARKRDGEDAPREALRTQASRQAMPMPPDKFHATRKGFPFHVLAARFASKRTVPLAYVRRRPGVAETTEGTVGTLLPVTRGLPAPNWILMDKWYNSSDAVRSIQETLRANGWERTRLLVPVTKKTGDVERVTPKTQAVSTGLQRKKPRQNSPGSRNLAAVAQDPRRGQEGSPGTMRTSGGPGAER